jgi:cation-transporting ATPase E
MKDFLAILRRNFLSPIVIAILILAITLLYLGEGRDAWFISCVIILNTLIAVVQEIRAQRALKKLELMSRPHARRRLPDGSTYEVTYDQLQVGDVIALQTGDEIPADGQVLTSSGLETDESILTGESAAVEKVKGQIIYAASAVTAGSADMQVTAIGSATKAGSMETTLKHYRPQLTPLQRAINTAINYLTYGALGLSLLIFIVYHLAGANLVQIIRTITTAAVAIVPEGLLLGSSLLLAFGSLKLTQAKVLPQKVAAIEAMALLEVLCVDKTGTLTRDEITFERIELFDETADYIPSLVSIVAQETSGGNITGQSILAGIDLPKQYNVLQRLSFSSARKLSGLQVIYNSKTYSVVMGAPEFVSELAPLSDKQKQQISDLTSVGKRVMLVATFDDEKISLKHLMKDSGRAMGLVVLKNELRPGVKKTVAYLQKNGVSLRVISGDNPETVQYIAHEAGIKGSDRIITGAQLQKVSKQNWDETVASTTIFARVLPEQKEHLIATLKSLGKYTGMVGDGINDALAIKKADLGVAMYAGASATRRVADIVLLDNSFNSLPMGMHLGNRIIQAIELIATLFFHKIIYTIILLLTTLLFAVSYPLMPRHISFINIFLVTLPTIMWTLFTPLPKHRLSPKYFWRDTLQAVAPIAALSGLMAATTYLVLRSIYPANLSGVSTTTVIIVTLFGIYLVFLVPRMFDLKNDTTSKLARLLYIMIVVIVAVPSFRLSLIRDFFSFTTPVWRDAWFLAPIILIVAFVQWQIAGLAGRRFKQREP